MPATISRVRVVHDDSAESPRENDNLGVFAGWHRRYKIGDVQPDCEPQEWLKDNAPPGSVVLSVYMIDHGGVAYSTSAFGDAWDSGQVGVIVATPDKIRECFMKKRISKKTRERVVACLKSEIETYSAWANGDVWGFVVETADGEKPTEIDSCYGFIGDDLDGMKCYVEKPLHKLLEEAWENRFDYSR
jgi:hypothetical protein